MSKTIRNAFIFLVCFTMILTQFSFVFSVSESADNTKDDVSENSNIATEETDESEEINGDTSEELDSSEEDDPSYSEPEQEAVDEGDKTESDNNQNRGGYCRQSGRAYACI